MKPRLIPIGICLPFVLFFVMVGSAHLLIHEFYFMPWPSWDENYVLYPIKAAGPLSLLGAFLLLMPRRSTQVLSVYVLVFLAVAAVPAHIYAAQGRLLFNDNPFSPFLSLGYVLFVPAVTLALCWLVFFRDYSRSEEKDSKS